MNEEVHFSMALKVYKDSACTQLIQTEIGRLEGDGSTTSFTCSENPTEVRKFSSSATNGELLTEGTDYTITDNGNGTYTVTLTTAPAEGETVIAIGSGEKIFSGLYAIGNSSVESDRTLEQQLFLKAENVDAQNVVVSFGDYVADTELTVDTDYTVTDNGDNTYTVTLTTAPAQGEGAVAIAGGSVVGVLVGDGSTTTFICSANPEHVYKYIGLSKYFYHLAPDNSGSPGTYENAGADLEIGSMNSGDVIPFWVKCIIPEGVPMSNYRDINIKITGLQFATN